MYTLQGKRGLSLAWSVLAVALCLLIILPAGHAFAADTPPMNFPQTFSGHVTINGAIPNPAVIVYAKLGPEIKHQETTDTQGRFGYNNNNPFYVSCNSTSDKLDFYVGATLAQAQVPYQPGAFTPLPPFAITTTALSVSTGAASNVASTTATLSGTLLNMGGAQSVTCYFQYGTTDQYGLTTPDQALTRLESFTANVISLTSGITYHFRAAAKIGSTIVYGDDQTLQTTSPALTVFTNAASSITGTAAILNGRLADKGTCQSVTVYFEYGSQQLGNTTPPQTLQTATSFTYNLTGLMPSTTYCCQAVAVCGSTTVRGAVICFTTPAIGLTVSTLAATDITANSATLNGSLLSMGGASPIYVNFQYGDATYPRSTANVPQYSTGTFSADIVSLTPNTTYHFRSAASGGAATGSDLTFKTLTQGGGGGQYTPSQFYGRVYIGSSAAAMDTSVEAWVSGALAASTTVDSSGRYGYTSIFYVPGTPGSPVTFKVAGTTAQQTATWTSAAMTNLNLSISAPAGPSISVTPTPLNFSTAQGGSNPASQVLTITNGGTGTLSCNVTSSATWLTVTPASGTATLSVTAAVTIGSMTTGTYPATITITSAGTGNSPVTVPVSFYISPPLIGPHIALDHTNFTFSTTAGVNPATQSLAISNDGTGTLSWQATDNVSWLTLSAGSGTNTGSTILTVIVSSLSNGTYPGKVTIDATGSTNTPQVVPVTLTIGISPTPTCNNVCIGSTSGSVMRYPKYYAFFAKYPSTCSSINTIYLQATGSGNAKAAIYRDNAGQVGTLLTANNSLTKVIESTCNPITVTATSTPDSYYWLAYWVDADYIAGCYPGAGTLKFMSTSSSFNFTDDVSGLKDYSGFYGVVSAGNN